MDNKDIYQVLVKHDERLKNIYSSNYGAKPNQKSPGF